MSAFNMLNRVPFNVTVPEFQPERKSPIFPQITRKYPCIENIAGLEFLESRARSRLSWKIQQPDPTLVFTGVKLVLPLKMQAFALNEDIGTPIDMRVCSKLPAANIALAETPMNAFRQTSLSINGRIFSEVNSYRRILDACYRGSSPSAYGDNHSLKPVVIRDMQNANSQQETFVVLGDGDGTIVTDAGGHPFVVRHNYLAGKTLDAAFSLLEHNGPFLERARKFQDNLSEDGKTWTDDVTCYLEAGPFQARARRGNTAVPYIRDMHLMLNFIGGESQFDREMGSQEMDQAGILPLRALPARLFEFGTLSNLRHTGETIQAYHDFITKMLLTWTAKPYLEITYTKYVEAMKPSYGLRCFERQYEKSNEFQLQPTELGSDKKLARVTSRILSMPTKIYVYGELSDVQKGAWANGGVRRSCRLDNIHCRINQRPNVVFNPSQEQCYEMFQRHTNSSLEYASWLKSPIYVFDPVDLAQPDMFANDARRTIFEWDAEVSMTPLQGQEEYDNTRGDIALAEGYDSGVQTNTNWGKDGAGTIVCGWDLHETRQVTQRDTRFPLEFRQEISQHNMDCELYNDFTEGDEEKWQNHIQYKSLLWIQNNDGSDPSLSEDARLDGCVSSWTNCRGLIWAKIKIDDTGDPGSKGNIINNVVYIVPRSFAFGDWNTPDKRQKVNPWSMMTVTEKTKDDPAHSGGGTPPQVPDLDIKGDPQWIYKVNDFDNLKWYRGPPKGVGAGKVIFNPQDPLPSGFTAWRSAIPGHYAYVTDRTGIRNTTAASDQDWLLPGPLANGTAPYQTIDQQTQDYRWVAFVPSDDMENGINADGNFLKFRGDTVLTSLPGGNENVLPAMSAGETQVTDTGIGQFGLKQIWNVSRGQTRRQTMGTHDMAEPTLPWYGQRCGELTSRGAGQHNVRRDYQLKVLYEFGNAQYQFSADGMPTKVLPNLVPVGPSAGIPVIQ